MKLMRAIFSRSANCVITGSSSRSQLMTLGRNSGTIAGTPFEAAAADGVADLALIVESLAIWSFACPSGLRRLPRDFRSTLGRELLCSRLSSALAPQATECDGVRVFVFCLSGASDGILIDRLANDGSGEAIQVRWLARLLSHGHRVAT